MIQLDQAELDELTNFAEELADVARQIIVSYFRSPLLVNHKPTHSPTGQPVTEADLEAETAMRSLITKHYPDHGIIGEELENINPDADLCWVLDPIDGTRAFIAGLPMFGILIGLGLKGKPILGVLDQPILKERFIGAGNNSTLNGKPIRSRKCQNLTDAVYSITDPRMMTGSTQQAALQKLMRVTQLTQFGGNCYAYGMLAAGSIDLITENDIKPWDIFALIPIIQAAGGTVTSWSGKAAETSPHVLACGDRKLHAEVLKLLRNAS
jgi:histidinol phosphatase-like enzyme (inositol monophosphatase family)